jgi:hypothetical protein
VVSCFEQEFKVIEIQAFMPTTGNIVIKKTGISFFPISVMDPAHPNLIGAAHRLFDFG